MRADRYLYRYHRYPMAIKMALFFFDRSAVRGPEITILDFAVYILYIRHHTRRRNPHRSVTETKMDIWEDPSSGLVFARFAIDQRVLVFFFRKCPLPALIRVFTACAAVARLLSYGAPRRSDLTIINDAIKVTTLICSRYTPRVKQVGGRRESLGRRYEAINHPGRGAETILINRYIVAVAADFLSLFPFYFCE